MNRVETNVFDELLYYLSHVGGLSWADFKQKIKRLTRDDPNFKASTYLSSLARLGHLDFDPMNLSYVTIAPAVLVETAVETRYVLIGSRVPSFLEKITKCVSGNGGKLRLIPEKYAPMTIVLSELTEKAFSDIESLNVYISREFSAKLSQILPRPSFMSIQPEPSVAANLKKKFNPTTLDYESVGIGESMNGLYQISQHGPDIYALRYGTNQQKVPKNWAEWFVLAGTPGLISYIEKSQIWQVTRKLLMPQIADRCATLCSGYPPKPRSKFVCYSDVPVDIAKRLTKSLYQDWEDVDVRSF